MAQRRLSRQPRIVPRLDAGNQLARNAAFVYVPSINREIVNGITGALSGSTPPVRTATTNGIGTKHTAGAATVSYVSLGVPAAPAVDIATGPCTFVGVFYANSTTGVAIAEHNDNNVTEGWVFGYTSGTAEGAIGLGFVKTYSIANLRKAITNTVVPGLNVLVVTFDGGALAAGCNIYLNGVLGTVSGSRDSTGTTSTDAANTLYVGRNTFDTSASHDGTILLSGAFKRLWTAAEVLSFSLNPWQIFKRPDRIQAVSADGVSASTATAAAGIATVSAVGASTAATTATSANGVATVSAVGAGSTAATATAAAGVATVSGTAASSAASAGTAAGFATVSGVGASGAATGATAATGVATVSGAGASSAVTTPTAAAGVATVSGGGGALIPSTATAAAGIATVSAVAQASTAASASAAAGVATVSGVGSANGAGTAAAAAGIATVSGIASSGGASAATPAAGVATVSGAGASSAKTTATAAAGSATVSAVGTGIIPTTATPADGTATVSGVGSTSAAGQATATPSSGTSTVSAVGASTAQTDASAAAGAATVSAVGSASASMTATPAAGLATVSATAESNAAAEATPADGVAAVSGVGSSTANAEADAIPADGIATVSATASSNAATSAIAAAGHATVSGTTPSDFDYEAMATAVWAFVLPNGKSAAETAVETLSLLEALSAAPGCLDVPIEGIFTGGDLLRVIAAVQAGKSTIASAAPGTATVDFRAIDDSVTRVSADMVGSERIDVEINAAD